MWYHREDRAKVLDEVCKELNIDKTKAIDALSIAFKEYRRILNLPTLPHIDFGGIKIRPSKIKLLIKMKAYNFLYKIGAYNYPQYLINTLPIYYYNSRMRYFDNMLTANKYRAQSFIKHHEEDIFLKNLQVLKDELRSHRINSKPALDRDTFLMQKEVMLEYLRKYRERKQKK